MSRKVHSAVTINAAMILSSGSAQGASARCAALAGELFFPRNIRLALRYLGFLLLISLGISHFALSATAAQAPNRIEEASPNKIHVYLWTGTKTHPPGRHDYPQFLADWSKILTDDGAVVDGALHAPSAADLEHTDVVIIYKGDAGFLSNDEIEVLNAYIKRGGGLVSLHDSLCGPDPAFFATLVGGGKKHGEVNYTNPAPVPYSIVDKSDPIMQGMSDLTLFDEAFFNLTWAKNPGIHVLATAVIAKTTWSGMHAGEVVPQIWTYEHTLAGGQPARAFVLMQGDRTDNFNNYQVQRMLLRGIAWAGRFPVDSLLKGDPPASPDPKQATP